MCSASSARLLRKIWPMKVAIVKERRAHERRVAASPDSVKRMVGMGLEAAVETGAGDAANFSDAAFAAAGASIATDAGALSPRQTSFSRSSAR